MGKKLNPLEETLLKIMEIIMNGLKQPRDNELALFEKQTITEEKTASLEKKTKELEESINQLRKTLDKLHELR